MVDTCDDSLLGIRDRALIAFAFYYGGRQRAQLAATTVESFERVTNSQGQLSHIVIQNGRVTKGLSPHAFYRIIVRRARQAG